MTKKPKIILLPGNGNSDIDGDHWYAWARDSFVELGFNVIAENMPDPEIARKDIWLPHIKNTFAADENTLIIGHSSGAVAALRYLETNRLLGVILVGACYTDLNDEIEKQSGYYNTPWQWQKIKSNVQWLVLFASQDDPYIPVTEPRFMHQQLNCEYHEYTDRGHFGSEFKIEKKFPELLEVVKRKMGM